MVSRNRKGSAWPAACSTAGAPVAARARAWAARAWARSASEVAWLARSVGFISLLSGGLRRRQHRMHHLAVARQQGAADDLVLLRQLRRLRLLVPEGVQEGEQVARVERGGGGRDAAGPVGPAQDLH